jgi:DNA-binding beta-propeller fold protein YncE
MDRREFLTRAAALPFVVAFVPDALRERPRLVRLGLVTADLEAMIVVVSLDTGRIRGHISTPPGPRSIERVGRSAAVVGHTTEGLVSVVDGKTLSVRHVVSGFSEPRYTAAHPDGRLAYVTDSVEGDVAVLDVELGRVLHRTALGGPARHISLDPRGGTLWVALGTKAEEVAIIDVRDAARPRLLRRIRPPFLAHDVGFAPGGRIWVTSGDRGAVAVYAATGREPAFRLQADAPPQHVTFLNERAYVASGESGTLRVHALGDGRLLHEARIPRGSYNVQQGEGVVLTPSLDLGTLCVVGGEGQVTRELRPARSSHDACVVLGV